MYDGRRNSDPPAVPLVMVLALTTFEANVTEESGADRVLFILENIEVTRVKEDWSFSSSSENGLKEVRLAISSVNFMLLLDLEDWPLIDPGMGEEILGDSMVNCPNEDAVSRSEPIGACPNVANSSILVLMTLRIRWSSWTRIT